MVPIGGSDLLLLDWLFGLAPMEMSSPWCEATSIGSEAPARSSGRSSSEVGAALGLGDKWLDPGPTDVLDLGLPEGFADRVETTRVRRTHSSPRRRFHQSASSFMQRWTRVPEHFADLRQLEPSADELAWSGKWALRHDPSEGFGRVLLETLALLGVDSDDV